MDGDGLDHSAPDREHAAEADTAGRDTDGETSERLSDAPEAAAAPSPDARDEPASEEPAPRPALASPAATYEGFPANDRGHPEDEDESGDGADYGHDELHGRDADSSANIDGDTNDGHWGDETARTAGAERTAFEHVEGDFDWDTLPDEEA